MFVTFLLGTAFGAVSFYLLQKAYPKFTDWLDAEIIATRKRLKP